MHAGSHMQQGALAGGRASIVAEVDRQGRAMRMAKQSVAAGDDSSESSPSESWPSSAEELDALDSQTGIFHLIS